MGCDHGFILDPNLIPLDPAWIWAGFWLSSILAVIPADLSRSQSPQLLQHRPWIWVQSWLDLGSILAGSGFNPGCDLSRSWWILEPSVAAALDPAGWIWVQSQLDLGSIPAVIPAVTPGDPSRSQWIPEPSVAAALAPALWAGSGFSPGWSWVQSQWIPADPSGSQSPQLLQHWPRPWIQSWLDLGSIPAGSGFSLGWIWIQSQLDLGSVLAGSGFNPGCDPSRDQWIPEPSVAAALTPGLWLDLGSIPAGSGFNLGSIPAGCGSNPGCDPSRFWWIPVDPRALSCCSTAGWIWIQSQLDLDSILVGSGFNLSWILVQSWLDLGSIPAVIPADLSGSQSPQLLQHWILQVGSGLNPSWIWIQSWLNLGSVLDVIPADFGGSQ
ncbi:uncharacterized protein LOC117008960 [Catharus ustulatus]|uniref:uncharacterized protein LOC117008960 n=1 Tax=Catharus ustulatus TaxID=91951 RepID=UPI001409D7BC|nr:uncharacterized protein LOC117008960 [Catharus ustulatus]